MDRNFTKYCRIEILKTTDYSNQKSYTVKNEIREAI